MIKLLFYIIKLFLISMKKKGDKVIRKIIFALKHRGLINTFNIIKNKVSNKFCNVQLNFYQKWLNLTFGTLNIESIKNEINSWSFHPCISVIIPVYKTDTIFLKKAVESVIKQAYPYWEICIADDFSDSQEIQSLLQQYSQIDPRIKIIFKEKNENISAASNSALAIVTGEYIALLDHDDELTIDALYENAKLINKHPDADFIYSDEDKIDGKGVRSAPFFKPDWSPEYFYSCMYTCHLGVYRKSLIEKIGGFRSEYDGAQDYDLVLRVIENTQNIYHIPKVLYSWRMVPSSTASSSDAKPWAYQAAQKALQAAIDRSPYPGWVEESRQLGFWRVRRNIIGQPLVSIIIPSAGTTKHTEQGSICVLQNCIDSINSLSTYKNIEIIVIDGYDIPQEILDTITSPRLRLVRSRETFNFSQRINQGVRDACGDVVLLLNDDTEVVSPDWIESMLEFAQQREIGAVGAKLYFPDGTIQHAGVTILDGNPGHVFYGKEKDHPGYVLSNLVNRNYWAVTGACLMVRKRLFDEVGGLDEAFQLNYNDVDFCLKLHQAGYRNLVTPYAELIHYESVSRHNEVTNQELERFNLKWQPYFSSLSHDPYYNSNLSRDGLMELRYEF